eukprot:5839092-Pleurochrysis_carterae.AAC.1
MEAVVLGVLVTTVGSQLRRLLVLCETNPEKVDASSTFQFFLAPWTLWSRSPKRGLPTPSDFDQDDDGKVEVAHSTVIEQMVKVRVLFLFMLYYGSVACEEDYARSDQKLSSVQAK